MATASPAFASALVEHHRDEEHQRLLPTPGHHNRELKDNAPYLLKKRSSKRFILLTVCVALFTVCCWIWGFLRLAAVLTSSRIRSYMAW